MKNISQILGTLLHCFQKANPKFVIKSPFSSRENHLLSTLIMHYQQTQTDLVLTKLAKLYLRILSNGNKRAYRRSILVVSRSSLVTPLIRNNILNKKSNLNFRTPSVPGPSRLCRVPFYPLRNENAWSSRFVSIDSTTPSRQAFGIEELGDDPILAIGPWLHTNDTTQAGPYTLVTRKIEFGAYRLIGVEIAAHYGSRYIGNVVDGTASTGSVNFNGPAAVAATAVFTVNTGGAGTSVGINIRVTTEGGLDETVTSANPVVNPNDFLIGANENDTATNLAAKLNAFGGITANAVANQVTVTMGQVGTIENGQIATSSNEAATRGISAPATGTFTGGSDNVSPNSTVTLTDTAGTSVTFIATRAGGAAPNFAIDQVVPATTADNLRAQIAASALNINPALVGAQVNVTQQVKGTGGDRTITSSFPVGGVTGFAVAGFTGGANSSLNLTTDLSPIALSIQEMVVYNGDNILTVEDSESVSIGEFNILNRPETFQYTYTYASTSLTPTGQAAATLPQFKGDASYKFIGLRDQPIVDPNSQVFVKVSGFIANVPTYAGGMGGYPADTPFPKIPPISLSINLVVDLLGDKIFGDTLLPSPAARPAANIKLGQKQVGPNRVIVTNTVFKKQP
jgi:hypothetical protein